MSGDRITHRHGRVRRAARSPTTARWASASPAPPASRTTPRTRAANAPALDLLGPGVLGLRSPRRRSRSPGRCTASSPAIPTRRRASTWRAGTSPLGWPTCRCGSCSVATGPSRPRSIVRSREPTPEEAAAKALERIAQGYQRLQVKVGDDPLVDAARVLAVREAVGPDVPIYADANCGFLLGAARTFVRALGTGGAGVSSSSRARRWTSASRCAAIWGGPMVLDETMVSLTALLDRSSSGHRRRHHRQAHPSRRHHARQADARRRRRARDRGHRRGCGRRRPDHDGVRAPQRVDSGTASRAHRRLRQLDHRVDRSAAPTRGRDRSSFPSPTKPVSAWS